MSGTFTRVHVARMVRGCDTCGRDKIQPGHTYRRSVAMPGAEHNEGGATAYTIYTHEPYGSCDRQARDGRYVPPEEAVRVWNSVHEVGARVEWHHRPRKIGERARDTTTRSVASVSPSGHAVIWLEGVSGWVNLDEVSPVLTVQRRRELSPGHERDTCGCDAGCSCDGAWCVTCDEELERRLRRQPTITPSWPCVPEMHALGVTNHEMWFAVEGRLWEDAHRASVAAAVESWNATHPVGTKVRVRYDGGSLARDPWVTAGPAVVAESGHVGLLPLVGRDQAADVQMCVADDRPGPVTHWLSDAVPAGVS